MNCRLCGAEASRIGERADIALHGCARCGFVSGRPEREPPADERYAGYHRGQPPPAPEARYEEWLTRAEAEVGRGRLLEVGAGSGGFVRTALRRGWLVEATEVSATGLEALRQTGATVVAGDLLDARLPAGRFDLVVSLEVVEHLPSPGEHLRELARITRPGGLLLLTTPNWRGVSSRWLGLRWRVVDPEHLGYFTPAVLARALRQAGYSRVSVRARSLDLTSWRRGPGPAGAATFDPHASASLRDRVESSLLLRLAKQAVNAVLAVTALGDSLLVWARR
jgi:SAM-dependent methyltransferase